VPEGHTIHRLARQQQKLFGGRVVHASSPQGRFVDGSALIDGAVLRRTEAYGKHLLHHYTGGALLHVHLGLYGKFPAFIGTPPEPVGALRLRLVGETWSARRTTPIFAAPPRASW
jgi:endonuclease-8